MDKYIIVSEYSEEEISKKVCRCMANGYVPQGGFAVVSKRDVVKYYQAMVLEEK